jgi:hypothetical protein
MGEIVAGLLASHAPNITAKPAVSDAKTFVSGGDNMVKVMFASSQELRRRIEEEFIDAQPIHPVVGAIIDGKATKEQLQGLPVGAGARRDR